MCDEVHEHGALAGVELHHSGAHCPRREYRLPAIAPSQLASDYLLVTPKAMELDDIRRVQDDWAAAARRAREAGFDIVYVYGGAQLPAHAVPVAVLQPAHGRVRRLAREPGPLLARAARADPRGRRRRVHRRDAHLRRCAEPVRRRPGRGPASSSASPTTSSTSGTSPSARRPSGRRTPAPRASSSRAGSSSGRGTCARRPRSRSSASRA